MRSDMWTMRFRFKTSSMIVSDNEKIKLKIGGRSVALQATRGGAINEAEDFFLIATDFNSEDDSAEFGNRIRNALLAASARAQFGLNVGRDKSTLKTSAAVKKAVIDKTGLIQRECVHGLMVYPSESQSVFSVSEMTGIVRRDSTEFFELLASSFDENCKINESLRTAIDLYCACCMEKSPTAKFIMAFAAIEQMSERPECPAGKMKLIENAIKFVKNEDALKSDKESVMNSIKTGKIISITKAVKNLVEKHLPDEIELFDKLSKFRGKIAHKSKIENRDKLPDIASQTQRIAGLLIERLLQATEKRLISSPS